MSLIECRDLHKDFSGISLFSGLSFSIEKGEKVALVGANGTGKTSLLRMIVGQDDDYSGRIVRAPGLRLGYAPQAWPGSMGRSAAAFLCAEAEAARARLASLEEEMSTTGESGMPALLEAYGRAREEYDALGGDDAEDAALRLLERAGLSASDGRDADLLSGGEKGLLLLLRALMGRPDLLILDEPGNHLDLWGQAWLEDYLAGLPVAVLVVSHNRWLLDKAASRILLLEKGRMTSYTGNYSGARLQILKQAAADGAAWQADRKKLERLEALVARFAVIAASRPDPAWGKRLRARRSQLERERAQSAQRPELDSRRIDAAFGKAQARSTFALIVEGYRKSYGGRVLFEGASFDLLRGEKAAIVGPNGCGKTSFIKDVVAASGRGDSGAALRLSPSMRLGYLSQAQDIFRAERSIVQEFRDLGATDEEAAKLLRKFLFARSDLGRATGELSGGELNRLQLARAVWLKSDFLVLDEPTNHLDIAGREAVEEALQEFDGTVLMVSHDRWLLESVAERIIAVEEGRFLEYEGSFAEYWRDVGRPSLLREKSAVEDRGRAIKGLKAAGAGQAKDQDIAARIEAAEKDKARAESAAAAAVEERNFAKARASAAEAEKIGRIIEGLYRAWLG